MGPVGGEMHTYEVLVYLKERGAPDNDNNPLSLGCSAQMTVAGGVLTAATLVSLREPALGHAVAPHGPVWAALVAFAAALPELRHLRLGDGRPHA